LIDECKHEDTDIFPDNWKSVGVFMDMITQWRVGMSGAIGLDYNVLPVIWNARRIRLAERGDLLDDLQIMEQAALEQMREDKSV
jgi:hypothetical protein